MLPSVEPNPINAEAISQTYAVKLTQMNNSNKIQVRCVRSPAELFMPEAFEFVKHHHQIVALRI